MIKNPAYFRAVDDEIKAQWLCHLTAAEAFHLAEEMDRFSRAMAPQAFLVDSSNLADDPHILMLQRVRAAFAKVVPPAQ